MQVHVDFSRALQKLDRVRAATQNAPDLMADLGETVRRSVQQNFAVGGRPIWTPNARRTVRRKGHNRPLIGTGGPPSSLSRLDVVIRPSSVTLRTQTRSRNYASIQQHGGRAGRGRATVIPARPFLVIHARDRTRMVEQTRTHLRRAVRRLA